jgi:L-fucose isomerase-like protein
METLTQKVRIGFVGFGEVNSPRELIERKCQRAIEWLESADLEVISTAPVSDDPAGNDVRRAIAELSQANFDVLVTCLAGWIPSHAVISVASEFRHHPMILWGLAGSVEDGRLVTTADQAGTTALRQTMEDLGWSIKYVPSFQNAPPPINKIATFARAASAVKNLRSSKIGMMGYRDMNLYATLYDGVSLRKRLGTEVEFFEMLEMVQRVEQLNADAVTRVLEDIQHKWVFEKPANPAVLETGVKYYLALREKVLERKYHAISLIDVDGMKKLLHFPPAMVFMLLADELNVCTIPENDVLGSVTQLITRALTGQASPYLEFYEFFSDGILMGVPDYVPSAVVDGPVKVTPTSFGGLAGGLLSTSRLKTGEVTLCRLASRGDHYILHVIAGDAATARPWEEAGWAPPAPQLPSLEIRLRVDMEEFTQKVFGQHYILSYGDNTAVFRDFCRLAGIEMAE